MGCEDLMQQRKLVKPLMAMMHLRRALPCTCHARFCGRPAAVVQRLLAYFEEESKPCGNCDICGYPPQLWDATVATRNYCQPSIVYIVSMVS